MTEMGAFVGVARRMSHAAQGGVGKGQSLLWRHRNLVRLGLVGGAVVVDMAAIVAASGLGAYLKTGDLLGGNWTQTFVLLAPTYLLAALVLHGYWLRTLRSLGRSVTAAVSALLIASGISFAAMFALKVSEMTSRLETGYSLLLAATLLVLFRAVGSAVIRRVFRTVVEPRFIVLTDGVGLGRRSGNRATTLIDVRQAGLVPALADPRFFDTLSRAVRDADRVVLSFSDSQERLKWSEAMRLSGLDAEIVADLGDVQPLALSHWESHPTLVISRGPLNMVERAAKRLFDLLVTGGLMLIAGPIIAVAALLVKLDSPGPVFFIQERVGRNNRTYRCFKLRTMRIDTVDTAGAVSASRGDARITRIGAILRRTSIDELPQLLNVLIGDMSLVGPRPHALGSRAEGALFWELVPDYWSRHSMKPGVTGLAQVRGLRGATHSRADIEQRVAADLEYINGWSLWLDIKILFMTIRVAVHPNAY